MPRLVVVAYPLLFVPSVPSVGLPNGACLVHNRYKHERSCRGPRRKFYQFHRIILNCVAVTSNCPRMYSQNEFPTLKKCRMKCAWHMKIRLPSNDTDSGSGSGAGGGGGGAEGGSEGGAEEGGGEEGGGEEGGGEE